MIENYLSAVACQKHAEFYSSAADSLVGLIYMKNFQAIGLSKLTDTQFWQYET